jgi:integrase
MKPKLGSIDCRRLSVKEVEGYLGTLDPAPKTRANHRITLRLALNVAAATYPISVRRRDVAVPTLTDGERLLEALKGDTLYSAFVVALYTGLRAGELAALRIEDVNLSKATARIHQQAEPDKAQGLAIRPLKTFASNGSLDLVPPVVAVLAGAIRNCTEGYVWESEPCHPYWPTSFTHALDRALSRAGLPYIRLHDLRHNFVSFVPQLDV